MEVYGLRPDIIQSDTYYVHARMTMRGKRVTVELRHVPVQVARLQQPALEARYIGFKPVTSARVRGNKTLEKLTPR